MKTSVNGMIFLRRSLLATIVGVVIWGGPARADYENRFSLGVGIFSTESPAETDFEVGAEYEYRIDPWFGAGLTVNYIFSSPSVTLISAPEAFGHPFGGDFLLNAAPLIEFGSGVGTHLGVRVGTRIPIPLGVVTLIPTFGVDFISQERRYIYGVGVQF